MVQEYFEPRLVEARKAIKDPPQAVTNVDGAAPRLKLTMNASSATPEPQKKLILKHGATTDTPPASTPGVTVDNEALERQQDLVRVGSTGAVKTMATEGKPIFC